jgi:hypothetical protein
VAPQACAYIIEDDSLANLHVFASTTDTNFALNKIHGFKHAQGYIKFLSVSLYNICTKILICFILSIQNEVSLGAVTVEFASATKIY